VKPRRPILGFGAGGLIAAALLTAIAGAMLAGVDVRHAILVLVYHIFGIDAVFALVSSWLVAQSIAVSEPIAGPLTLLYLLPVMHIAPGRRAPWLWIAVSGGLVLAPMVPWWLALYGMRAGVVSSPQAAFFWGTLAVDTVFFFGLWLLIRSRTVLVTIGTIGILAIAMWKFAAAIVEYIPLWEYWPWFWHGAIATTLMVWAMRSRAYRPPAFTCQNCGYDLKGLTPGACPECGTTAGSRNPVEKA
jgi:hypothetical protein